MLEALAGLELDLYKTLYQAVKATGTSESILTRRFKGGNSRAEARESQQTLSKAQEKALASWITDLTATGHPAHHDFIRDMAEQIRKQYKPDGNTRTPLPIGETWVQQFIKRHLYLKTILSHSIEAARIKDVTMDVVMDWFNKFEEMINNHQFKKENIYNMDEIDKYIFYSTNIGFSIGKNQTLYIVINSRLCRKY